MTYGRQGRKMSETIITFCVGNPYKSSSVSVAESGGKSNLLTFGGCISNQQIITCKSLVVPYTLSHKPLAPLDLVGVFFMERTFEVQHLEQETFQVLPR